MDCTERRARCKLGCWARRCGTDSAMSWQDLQERLRASATRPEKAQSAIQPPPTLNLRAMVRPMPELAPVGIATLPLSIVMRHLPSVVSRVEEGGHAEAKCGNP